MNPTHWRSSRAVRIGGTICLVAVLAVLLGGLARADAAAHHRSTVAVGSALAADNHGSQARIDQPGAVAALAAVGLLALLLVRRTRRVAEFTRQPTAYAPIPRSPPLPAP